MADDATEEEVELLMDGVKELTSERMKGAPIYIETRNFNDYSRWKDAFAKAGFEYVPHLNFHVDTSSVEVAEANLGRNRKRDIRTSFRDGAIIVENPTIEQVREFYAILKQLYATKVKTPLFPLSFFERLYLHQDARFLLVGLPKEAGEIEIIGGAVCVALAGKCLYEWVACGRDGEWKSIFPSSVATYAGIRYATEHGMPRLDMMGAGKPEEAYGVRDFKARFGGNEVEYGRFLYIASPMLYKIGETGVKALKNSDLKKFRGGGKILINDQIDREAWRAFVARHPYGTIFQTPEMYDVYQKTVNQYPVAIAFERGGKIKGIMLAVIQWNGGAIAKPLTARSIIIGGPQVVHNDEEITLLLLREYRKILPWYVIYSEIRPIKDLIAVKGILDSARYHREGHYNILLRTTNHEPSLWENMHKERRRNVEQAKKAGLRFTEVDNKEERDQIVDLIRQTYRRKHVPFAGESLFEHIEELMPSYVHFFAAYHEDKMIAGQIRLGYKDLLYAWYAGSDERYLKMRPNDFLMWNVICWAHKNGYKWFDFGGGGEPGVAYGVRDYKLKYGCEMYDYGRYINAHRPLIYKSGKQAYKIYHKLKGK